MPVPDFTVVHDRRRGDSSKWTRHDPALLPAWVADVDFPAPEPVLDAIARRLRGGWLGYADAPASIAEAVAAWMTRRHGWAVDPAWVVHLPGVVNGFNAALRLAGSPGDEVVLPTPTYPPMLDGPRNQGRVLRPVELRVTRSGPRLSAALDVDALDAVLGRRTSALLLCSPHNPTGHVFSAGELDALADRCRRYGLLLVSDDIWCDLVPGDAVHRPLAAVDDEVAMASITLVAPSKTFNIPAMGYAAAIVPDPELREQFADLHGAAYADPNVLGLYAARAAYTECDDWLDALLVQLRINRDMVAAAAGSTLPGVAATVPEATYLAWLDCRDLIAQGMRDPWLFFQERAGVLLSDGRAFGPGGDGFVRLNFGCAPTLLDELLGRMAGALAAGW